MVEDHGSNDGESDEVEAAAWMEAMTAPTCSVVALPGGRQPDPLPPLPPTNATVRPALLRAAKSGVRTAPIAFLADTGANITCVAPRHLEAMNITTNDLVGTNPPPRVPAQAGGSKEGLQGVGLFKAKIRAGNKQIMADVYVYNGLKRPLLSRQHCLDLDVWKPGPNGGCINALQEER